jgi:hypothetical protein
MAPRGPAYENCCPLRPALCKLSTLLVCYTSVMRFVLVITVCLAAAVLATATEVYEGKPPPIIERIELTDGRVLEQAQILGDTAYTVTVRHGSRVEKIDKAILPEELRRQWPVSANRAAAEKREAEKLAKQQEAARRKAERIREAVRREQIREAKESAARNAKLDAERRRQEEERARVAAAIEQLRARSRDGVLLSGFSRDFGSTAVRLQVRNLQDAPRRLEWRSLQALTLEGATVPAADVRFALKESASYDLATRQSRSFTVVFNRTDIVALGWADRPDLGWVGKDGAAVEPAAAIAAEKQRRVEQLVEKRKRQLVPVEGQLVQK